jgi:sarcosine oxidase/L-pipecolate oxidase
MSDVKCQPIIIVGGGAFGLSTALELANRGYNNVTVLDRRLPPVPEGSSVDISRIIRFDYADKVYAKMALEAYQSWKKDFAQHFHETPFMMVTSEANSSYIEATKKNLGGMGRPVQELRDWRQIQKHIPTFNGEDSHYHGYINHMGGWADAEGAIAFLAKKCSAKGVSFVTGQRGTVTSLVMSDKRVTGVKVSTGDVLHGARVIIATGAWTPQILNMKNAVIATAQPVGTIQLTQQEADRIRDMPIYIEMDTGFFCFPPNADNLLKAARHGFGYENPVPVIHSDSSSLVSGPKLKSNGLKAAFIPEEGNLAIRQGLKHLLPEFADRPWLRTSLCWYSDTHAGDFIVDRHPDIAGLFVATGGSGQ